MNRRVTIDALNVLTTSQTVIPDPPPGGAVIKVVCAGVCHSDVHIRRRMYHPKFTFPRVLGHEISGVIHSMGDGSQNARPDLAVGDRVCVFPWGMCQNCDNCEAGLPYCITMHYGSGPVDTYVYGIWRDGGYQEYVVIDLVKFLEKVPDGVSMDTAAILTCSGVTSYNAVMSLQESIDKAKHIGDGTVLAAVIGAGGLALWAIQILKALHPGAVKVVAVDISDDKLHDAEAAGADITHKWGTTESAEEAAAGLIQACGRRPDAIIDYIGLALVVLRAHTALNIGGTLCLVGLTGNEMPAVSLNSIIRRNVNIKGVIVGSQSQCHEVIKLVQHGKVKPPPISHIQLEDLSETLDSLQHGTQRGRAVIKF